MKAAAEQQAEQGHEAVDEDVDVRCVGMQDIELLGSGAGDLQAYSPLGGARSSGIEPAATVRRTEQPSVWTCASYGAWASET